MSRFQLKFLFLSALAILFIETPNAWANNLNRDDCIKLTTESMWDSENAYPYIKLDQDIQKQLKRFHHRNDSTTLVFKIEDETILVDSISFAHKNFTQKDIPIESALQTAIMKHRSELENGRCYIGRFYVPSLALITAETGKSIIFSPPIKAAAFIIGLPIIIPVGIIQYTVWSHRTHLPY